MTKVTVLPEMLGRHDTVDGIWDVHECAPVRGLPHTSIADRKIVVPHGEGEMERAVRAHEMMHAKVSPGADFEQWMGRNVASENALRVVEEVRVNHLCNLAGFDVKKHLADGGEAQDGERCALAGDWAGAVYSTVAYCETASLNQFITGVRRHNPEWAAALRAVANRVVRAIKKVPTHALAATHVDMATGLAPHGFIYTERIAEFVDRIAHPPVDENEDDGEAGNSGDESAFDGEDRKEASDEGKKAKSKKKPPVTDEEIKKMKERPNVRSGSERWGELRPFRLPLNRPAPGGLGKRRSPTSVGRNPRRIERMLTDPHRRVFDRVVRGNGGVVLIDASGSMSLTQAELRSIVEASPGATVACYSADNADQPVNLWVLADRGRMVSEMPPRHSGNGVDLPAIEWAVAQKQRSSSPVIWITDGYVMGISSHDHEWDAFECAKFCVSNGVVLRNNVADGLVALQDLSKGRKPRPWWPQHWSIAYKKYLGKRLRSSYRAR